MNLGEAALWWLPTAAVVAMTVVGLVVAAAQPWRPGRKYLIVTVLVIGALAIGASAWQQNTTRRGPGDTARLRARLDEVARLLPAGPGATPTETFDRIAAALMLCAI